MTDITVSDDLAARIEDRLEHTDFESVDAYAEFVLSEVVTRVEREDGDAGAREATASAEEVQSRHLAGYPDSPGCRVARGSDHNGYRPV